MTLPFDTPTKDFLSAEPEAWLQLCGQSVAREDIRVDDADLATVETSSDKVLRLFVGEPREWVLSFEFQSGWDGTLGNAIALRWAALRNRFGMPVSCAVVLLKPKADQPAFTEEGLEQFDALTNRRWFVPCRFVRMWELDPEELLKGPLTLAGLAPVANVAPAEVESVVDRLKNRLLKERDGVLAKKVYVGSRLLMGLRYDEAMIGSLYGENFMAWWSESSVYQAALKDGEKIGIEKGEQSGLKKGLKKGLSEGSLATLRTAIRELGEERFGPIPPSRSLELEAMTDQGKLKKLLQRVLTAESWDQLFGKSKRK